MSELADLAKPPAHLEEAKRAASCARDYPFDISWKDPSGKLWLGSFVSRVPSIGQQIDIAKRVAVRAHTPGDAKLPDDVNDLIYTVAYLEVALTERPDWARDIEAIPYVELLNELGQEATQHLTRFRQH